MVCPKELQKSSFTVILSDSNSDYCILSTTGNEMDFIKINHSIMFWENIGFEITDKLDSYFSLTGRELEVCIIYDGGAD